MLGLFGKKEQQSKEVAKERLRLVLMQDRLSLAPHTMEQMKDAVIVAISRFVEIDPHGIEFSWKDSERKRALVASIPVISVKRGASRDD
ncbi:MAG TPA: cell division topological specificity factor MinE [Firmicutes bacterium]|nr:cell division topological specificity factor MinE [Candidatus Fermentithermobacillaceae bacterium]